MFSLSLFFVRTKLSLYSDLWAFNEKTSSLWCGLVDVQTPTSRSGLWKIQPHNHNWVSYAGEDYAFLQQE